MTDRRGRLLAVAVLVGLISSAAPATVGATAGAAANRAAATPRGAGLHRDALLVRFAAATPDSAVAAVLAAAGATEVGRLAELNTVVVTPDSGRTRGAVHRALAAAKGVALVEEDQVGQLTLTPDDTYWSEEWYAPKVHLDSAWDVTTGGDGPVIAVLDTGVQASQPDLVGRVLRGRDFVNNDRYAADDLGHGTKVAGVIAGKGMNALGVAGACWSCRILPVKVADRHGNVLLSNAAAGLIWATNHGARVVNMSFGKTTGTSTMADAVKYARRHGVVVVASAGNEGNRKLFYPAAYWGVLSVAATDENDQLKSWSTHGAWVKLAAPGCAYTTMKAATWGPFCGTSASAPIVAGIAGLILAVKPDATRLEVMSAIQGTAVPIGIDIGGGLVDAFAAVQLFAPPPPEASPSPSP